MSKKLLAVFTILFLLAIPSFSDETGDTNIVEKTGFDTYLSQFIQYNVTVYISANDVSVSGKLLEVYKDGIVIESMLLKKNVFINKDFISYIDIKKR